MDLFSSRLTSWACLWRHRIIVSLSPFSLTSKPLFLPCTLLFSRSNLGAPAIIRGPSVRRANLALTALTSLDLNSGPAGCSPFLVVYTQRSKGASQTEGSFIPAFPSIASVSFNLLLMLTNLSPYLTTPPSSSDWSSTLLHIMADNQASARDVEKYVKSSSLRSSVCHLDASRSRL
ncbi:hypothetical protein BDP27DRAFT_1346219 [Rhodocollybia butyracea]|uniref:Uncharacterized protein n=1 Tax=Rhodocollybia butyracea TaxID=206335 RepID=A0A9P5TXR5_9AGAR|nr:hypothetical protein BDP27DRAFT_1346219 [Rhodocollybia butyracea]